jgi:hypothetical protein
MARFRYLGEPSRPGLVVAYGPCLKIRVKKKDGTTQELTPVSPATSFVIGEDIGHEITDERVLRHIRADTTRFEEIT